MRKKKLMAETQNSKEIWKKNTSRSNKGLTFKSEDAYYAIV